MVTMDVVAMDVICKYLHMCNISNIYINFGQQTKINIYYFFDTNYFGNFIMDNCDIGK